MTDDAMIRCRLCNTRLYDSRRSNESRWLNVHNWTVRHEGYTVSDARLCVLCACPFIWIPIAAVITEESTNWGYFIKGPLKVPHAK